MRTSRVLASLVFAAALVAGTGACAERAVDPGKPASARAAYEEGIDALRAGRLDSAIPALEIASNQQILPAEYYLARVYSTPSSPHADHVKAFKLFQRIVESHADIDAQDDRRTPYVAKSLVALAGYLRRGLAEYGVKPDVPTATRYLQHAAAVLDDEDAQFELARHSLADGMSPEQSRIAMHWLAVLTQRGHPGAQAFLADLYWRGKHVVVNRERALALVTIAVENAPAHDRIWIEDIHQEIFCGAPAELRRQVDAQVPEWRVRYARSRSTVIEQTGLPSIEAAAVRTCANGEIVVRAPAVPLKSETASSAGIRQGAAFKGTTGSLPAATAPVE